jgi:hypothetical protein
VYGIKRNMSSFNTERIDLLQVILPPRVGDALD